MTCSLSLIIPTLGRPTLLRALRSVVPQLFCRDEVIVVGDGEQPVAREIAREFHQVVYLETEGTSCWGHAERNLGMKKATGTHLAFLDDDDVWLPGARSHIEAASAAFRDQPVFFRMEHGERTIWVEKEVRYCNISTQMYLFPNVAGKLGTWRHNPDTAHGSGGDYLFARDTVDKYPAGASVFADAVIAKLFFHSEGR